MAWKKSSPAAVPTLRPDRRGRRSRARSPLWLPDLRPRDSARRGTEGGRYERLHFPLVVAGVGGYGPNVTSWRTVVRLLVVSRGPFRRQLGDGFEDQVGEVDLQDSMSHSPRQF